MVAVIGLNLLTGFAGLISIGHAAFVGIGAYTLASFARVLGDSHIIADTHAWPLMIVLAGLWVRYSGPSSGCRHAFETSLPGHRHPEFPDDLSVDHQLSAFFQPGADHRHRPGVLVYRQSGRKDHYLFWYYVILVLVVILSGFMLCATCLRTRMGVA
jgi:branched-chain amino acid transport system permease protein